MTFLRINRSVVNVLNLQLLLQSKKNFANSHIHSRFHSVNFMRVSVSKISMISLKHTHFGDLYGWRAFNRVAT